MQILEGVSLPDISYCRKCSVQLEPDVNWYKSFYSRGAKLCSICNTKKKKDWHANNPEESYLYSRERSIKQNYGISLEEYHVMYAEQNGLCKICGTNIAAHKSDIHHTACIDHNHTTGKIRGLLCIGCNRGIGYLGDNPEIIIKAYQYLIEQGYSPYDKMDKVNKNG